MPCPPVDELRLKFPLHILTYVYYTVSNLETEFEIILLFFYFTAKNMLAPLKNFSPYPEVHLTMRKHSHLQI